LIFSPIELFTFVLGAFGMLGLYLAVIALDGRGIPLYL
jgi:hypothetical protein